MKWALDVSETVTPAEAAEMWPRYVEILEYAGRLLGGAVLRVEY